MPLYHSPIKTNLFCYLYFSRSFHRPVYYFLFSTPIILICEIFLYLSLATWNYSAHFDNLFFVNFLVYYLKFLLYFYYMIYIFLNNQMFYLKNFFYKIPLFFVLQNPVWCWREKICEYPHPLLQSLFLCYHRFCCYQLKLLMCSILSLFCLFLKFYLLIFQSPLCFLFVFVLVQI